MIGLSLVASMILAPAILGLIHRDPKKLSRS